MTSDKKILALLLILFTFGFQILGDAQCDPNSQFPCDSANPFCSTQSYDFPNTTGNASGVNGAPCGPDYGCLLSTPNPVWYYMRIGTPGIIKLSLTQYSGTGGTGATLDVDFAMWGPYNSVTYGCNSIMNGGSPIQCSYSPSYSENLALGAQGGSGGGQTTPPAGQSGEYYLILITNYSGSAGYIQFSQSNVGGTGAGSTDCTIINPCNYTVSVAPTINVCTSSPTADLATAFDAANSDPSVNTYFSSFTDANDSINPLSSSVVGPGTYYIRSNSTDSLPCYALNAVNVVSGIDNPSFTVSDYCQGATNQAIGIITPGGTFSFNPPATDGATINPSTGAISGGVGGTTYFVQYATNGNCPNDSVQEVTVNVIPGISVPNDTSICLGDTLNFSAYNPDTATIIWNNSIQDGVNFVPSAVDTLQYVATLSKNGCSSTDTVTVFINPNPPQANFAALITKTCPGTPVPFINYTDTLSGQILTANWDFGDGDTAVVLGKGDTYDTTYHAYSQTGTYDITLVVSNQYGCSDDKVATQYINIVDGPTAAFSANPSQTDLSNTNIVFTNTSTNATHYSWNFGDGVGLSTDENPSYVFPNNKPGVYTVVLYAMNDINCMDSVSHQVTIIYPDPIYKLPNIFTPNGDGVNDVFKFVKYENISKIKLVILNRWGNKVYESDKVNFSWNGEKDNSGAKCDDGVYFYNLELTDFSGTKSKKAYGYVHLNREKK